MTNAVSDSFNDGFNNYGLASDVGKIQDRDAIYSSEQNRKIEDLFKKQSKIYSTPIEGSKTFMSGCMRDCGIKEIDFTGSYTDRYGNTYSAGVKIIGDTEGPEKAQETEEARDCDNRSDPRDHEYE